MKISVIFILSLCLISCNDSDSDKNSKKSASATIHALWDSNANPDITITDADIQIHKADFTANASLMVDSTDPDHVAATFSELEAGDYEIYIALFDNGVRIAEKTDQIFVETDQKKEAHFYINIESQLTELDVNVYLYTVMDYGFNVTDAVIRISNDNFDRQVSTKIDESSSEVVSTTFSGLEEGNYTINVQLLDNEFLIAEGSGETTVTSGYINEAGIFIISWENAEVPLPTSFIGKLRTVTALEFDLPTEAQWEYACRAGTTTSYYNGTNCSVAGMDDSIRDPNLDPLAWYGPDWHDGGGESGPGTREVGLKEPNPWGLYDMLGNVWEVCLDWYGDYEGDAIDPAGATSGLKRVARGGSWHTWPAVTRAANRQQAKSGRMAGFRLVCPADEIDSDNLYMIIDLSDENYSVTYLTEAPEDLLDNDDYQISKLVMRRIPAGTFMMGSPEDEVGRYDDEVLHEVTLTEDFYIGVFEVTQGQWGQLIDYNLSYYQGLAPADDPNYFYKLPIESVTWESDIRGGNWPASSSEKKWEKTFGGSSVNTCYSVRQTDDGGYIVIGSSLSDDVPGVSNDGEMDNYILKLNGTGEIMWHKMYGGSDNDMGSMVIPTDDQGYIALGYTRSTDIDQISAFTKTGGKLGNAGDTDLYVYKLDSSGNVEWNKTYGNLYKDKGFSVIQTSDKNYVIAGITYLEDPMIYDSNADYYLLKLNSTGELLWEKTFGGDYLDEGYALQETSDGGLIVAGTSFVEPGLINSDFYVLKIDKNGDTEWEKTFGGSGIDNCFAVKQTTDDGYILAGCADSTDINDLTNNGDMDIYIIRFDSDGNIIWQYLYGGTDVDKAYSIRETTDNGFIVTGDTKSDLGNCTNNGMSDIFIMKLDETGMIDWQCLYGGSGIEYGRSIQQTDDAGYIIGGTTSTVFDPQDMVTEGSAFYVIKM
jgi:formylglycine-generating enzyme required for sulfatase activity